MASLSRPSRPSSSAFWAKNRRTTPPPNALALFLSRRTLGDFDFPADGEYEFHMRDANYRPRDESDAAPAGTEPEARTFGCRESGTLRS